MMELILLEQTGSSDQRYSGSLPSTSRPLTAVCKVMTVVCLLQLITSFVSKTYLHPSQWNTTKRNLLHKEIHTYIFNTFKNVSNLNLIHFDYAKL